MNRVVIYDTREQAPWEFPTPMRRAKLDYGDYSIEGMEDDVAVERKSGEDFIRSISHERGRFFRELAALSRFRWSAVVVEDDLRGLLTGARRVTRASTLATIGTIAVDYRVPVLFFSDRAVAIAYVSAVFERLVREKDGEPEARKRTNRRTPPPPNR